MTFGRAGAFDVVKCSHCATLFTATLPASEEQAEDYSGYYDEKNLNVPAFVEKRLGEVASSLERYRTSGRWLDIGCGAGALLRAAERQGWSATGTEIAPNAVDVLREQGLDVRLGELDELGLEPGGFDVVSLVEVVEHVADPLALVDGAARLVRPGGAVYVTTPNGRSVSARLLGARWSLIAPPEHLLLLSRRGIRVLFERAGLLTKRVETHAINPHELRAALGRRQPVGGCQRVNDAYALNESLSSGRVGRLVKRTVNGGLSLTGLGDSLKATAERPA